MNYTEFNLNIDLTGSATSGALPGEDRAGLDSGKRGTFGINSNWSQNPTANANRLLELWAASAIPTEAPTPTLSRARFESGRSPQQPGTVNSEPSPAGGAEIG